MLLPDGKTLNVSSELRIAKSICLRLFLHCVRPRRLAGLLDGRHQQGDQHGVDGDDDE